MFKKGDKVEVMGSRASNPMFGTGVCCANQTSAHNIVVLSDNGSGSWTVRATDLRLVNDAQQKQFRNKFLTKAGRELLDDGYLEVSISASQQMKDELEAVAVDSFVKNYKPKKKAAKK